MACSSARSGPRWRCCSSAVTPRHSAATRPRQPMATLYRCVWVLQLIAALATLLVARAATSPSTVLPEELAYIEQQLAAAPTAQPDFQADALRAFAGGLEADPYGVLPLWTGLSHPCGDASNNLRAWPGVTCDGPTGSVTAIQLPGRALAGTLPKGVAVIRTLRVIDLSDNRLRGSLPSAWSNLTALASLDLSHNALEGPLPPAYGAWDAMQSLVLNDNQLTGPLPGSWAGMNLLEVLDLSSNALSGSLPDSWGGMGFLSVLDLHNNSLSGTLPNTWAQQRSLLQLHLGDNGLGGWLPHLWAGGMDRLRGVNVTANSLSGSLPEAWSNITTLQALLAAHNQLTGSIPAAWGALPNLYALNVTRNSGICGGVPFGVEGALADANATQLRRSCAWERDAQHLLEFKAGLQDPSGALSSWREGNNPCSALPWAGVSCEDGAVVAVQLQGLPLRGPLSQGLARIAGLRQLSLARSELWGTLPAEYGDAGSASLTLIELGGNELRGTLPSGWGRLQQLQQLSLSQNQLEGSLPPEWAALSSLHTLMLGGNRALNGTLPAEWSQLLALQKIHLDGTSIQGTVPAAWARLTSVQELGLSSNALTGSLPAPLLAALPRLAHVDVSGNQQMCGQLGRVPLNVTLLTDLTQLGSPCGGRAGRALATAQAVGIGLCASVASAALLAGAACVVRWRRQQQGLMIARGEAAASPRSLRPAAGARVPCGTAREPASPLRPVLGPQLRTPPCSPAASGVAAAGPPPHALAAAAVAAAIGAAPPKTAAATSAGCAPLAPLLPHRLATGSSSALETPRDAQPGPIVTAALVAASDSEVPAGSPLQASPAGGELHGRPRSNARPALPLLMCVQVPACVDAHAPDASAAGDSSNGDGGDDSGNGRGDGDDDGRGSDALMHSPSLLPAMRAASPVALLLRASRGTALPPMSPRGSCCAIRDRMSPLMHQERLASPTPASPRGGPALAASDECHGRGAAAPASPRCSAALVSAAAVKPSDE